MLQNNYGVPTWSRQLIFQLHNGRENAIGWGSVFNNELAHLQM